MINQREDKGLPIKSSTIKSISLIIIFLSAEIKGLFFTGRGGRFPPPMMLGH
jgi:hypothetical protein